MPRRLCHRADLRRRPPNTIWITLTVGITVQDSLEHLAAPTMEDKVASLMGDSPYGRCVWKCDMDDEITRLS